MPVSRVKVTQNPGDAGIQRGWPALAPSTVSQPDARIVTGGSRRFAVANTSAKPPPMSIGQLIIPCGTRGRSQIALARATTRPRWAIVTAGSFLGTG